jgi:PleD family two-component response regulator
MNTQDRAPTKIMVVTQDPDTLGSATAILEEAGYEVHSVSQEEGCAAGALRLKPDLILMDASADAVEIGHCRSLKADAATGRIPVVLMITDFQGRTLAAAHEFGAADCVRTPLNRGELRWRVERLTQLCPAAGVPNEAGRYKEILETAAEVCHKLNQPLQYVMGTVQFLLMDMSTEDKLFDRLDMVRQKAELMGDITRKLTTLTRKGAQS